MTNPNGTAQPRAELEVYANTDAEERLLAIWLTARDTPLDLEASYADGAVIMPRMLMVGRVVLANSVRYTFEQADGAP